MTYFLEREDGSWVALALRLMGQADDGVWILCGDFKTSLGESSVLFGCNHAASPDEPDVFPVKQESIRGSPVDVTDPDSLRDDPMMAVPLAMNLLMVRRWPAATESLRSHARHVSYPCGIERAYPLITPGLGFQKHHDINPRVMLTGVACLSTDGNKNPMTATSFGLNDPVASGSISDEDFLDLSHAKSVVHDGFSLTYPATWFLRRAGGPAEPGAECLDHLAQSGGISCSASLSVSLYSGTADRIAAVRSAMLARLGAAQDGTVGRLLPRQGQSLRSDDNAREFISDLDKANMNGIAYYGVYSSESGERLARITAFGCIATASPRCVTTLAEMEPVFGNIVRSFRFA